jgi:hypothetical protein
MAWDECQHGLTHGFGHGFRHGFASERNKREEPASAKSSEREYERESFQRNTEVFVLCFFLFRLDSVVSVAGIVF